MKEWNWYYGIFVYLFSRNRAMIEIWTIVTFLSIEISVILFCWRCVQSWTEYLTSSCHVPLMKVLSLSNIYDPYKWYLNLNDGSCLSLYYNNLNVDKVVYCYDIPTGVHHMEERVQLTVSTDIMSWKAFLVLQIKVW